MDIRLLCSINMRIYVWMSSFLNVSQANMTEYLLLNYVLWILVS